MLVANALERGIDLVAPHTVAVECESGHLQCQLKLADHRLGRAKLAERDPLLVAVGAHHDVELWIDCPREVNGAPGGQPIRHRDDQHPRLLQVRLLQQDRRISRTEEGWHTGITQAADDRLILLKHEEAKAASLERLTESPVRPGRSRR